MNFANWLTRRRKFDCKKLKRSFFTRGPHRTLMQDDCKRRSVEFNSDSDGSGDDVLLTVPNTPTAGFSAAVSAKLALLRQRRLDEAEQRKNSPANIETTNRDGCSSRGSSVMAVSATTPSQYYRTPVAEPIETSSTVTTPLPASRLDLPLSNRQQHIIGATITNKSYQCHDADVIIISSSSDSDDDDNDGDNDDNDDDNDDGGNDDNDEQEGNGVCQRQTPETIILYSPPAVALVDSSSPAISPLKQAIVQRIDSPPDYDQPMPSGSLFNNSADTFATHNRNGIDDEDDDDLPSMEQLSQQKPHSNSSRPSRASIRNPTIKPLAPDIEHFRKFLRNRQPGESSSDAESVVSNKSVKQLQKEERQRQAELKRQERERIAEENRKRRAVAQANRVIVDKRVALQEIIMVCDPLLSNRYDLQEKLPALDLRVELRPLAHSSAVIWERETNKRWDRKSGAFRPLAAQRRFPERFVCVVYEGEEFARLVGQRFGSNWALEAEVEKLRRAFPRKVILFLIERLEAYYRKRTTERNRSFRKNKGHSQQQQQRHNQEVGSSSDEIQRPEKEGIREALYWLQEQQGCRVMTLRSEEHIVDWLHSYSREIAIGPYEKSREITLPTMISEGSASSGKNLADTWSKMLQVMSGITPPIAQAITERFPTFQSLFSRYTAVSSQRERENILSDAVVNRHGYTSSGLSRRLGPALSKRLSMQMYSLDPQTSALL